MTVTGSYGVPLFDPKNEVVEIAKTLIAESKKSASPPRKVKATKKISMENKEISVENADNDYVPIVKKPEVISGENSAL